MPRWVPMFFVPHQGHNEEIVIFRPGTNGDQLGKVDNLDTLYIVDMTTDCSQQTDSLEVSPIVGPDIPKQSGSGVFRFS